MAESFLDQPLASFNQVTELHGTAAETRGTPDAGAGGIRFRRTVTI